MSRRERPRRCYGKWRTGDRLLSCRASPLSCVFQALVGDKPARKGRKTLSPPPGGRQARGIAARKICPLRRIAKTMAIVGDNAAGAISPPCGEKAISMPWPSPPQAVFARLSIRNRKRGDHAFSIRPFASCRIVRHTPSRFLSTSSFQTRSVQNPRFSKCRSRTASLADCECWLPSTSTISCAEAD